MYPYRIHNLDLIVDLDYNFVKISFGIGDTAVRTLHYKLFIRYCALIFPAIFLFMIALYIILGSSLQTNTKNELQADCDNISTLLDTRMDSIDQLSKRIVSSSKLRTAFREDLYSGSIDAYHRSQEFSKELFDIIKLFFDDMSLHMVDVEGRHVYVGSIISFRMEDVKDVEKVGWFQTTLDGNGKKLLLPAHMPELDAGDSPVVSLCRAFAPGSSRNETAVLEIQFQYDRLAKDLRETIHNNEDRKKVYVYDGGGQLIYPYEDPPSAEMKAYFTSIAETPDSGRVPMIYKPEGGSSQLVACRYSSYTDWTVFVTASEREILSTFYLFRILTVIVSVLLVILLLFITYRIAERLTTPLKQLEQSAHSLTFDNLDVFEMPDCKNTFRELDSLYHSFGQMKENLQNSLENVIRARTMANDAKMMALQSQMNPHFLYNTLASISALAENEETEKVVEICDSLTSLLRYISSGASKWVTVEEEMEQTYSYIHLIEVKYGERIRFDFDVDEMLLGQKIPKLLVQPLVENCVKYALNVPPPWIISIHIYKAEEKWIIQVEDNGSGFSEEYLKKFKSWISQIDSDKPLPELEINGMGLLNLYTRLYLKYGKKMSFELKNRPVGGACVTLGTPLEEEE